MLARLRLPLVIFAAVAGSVTFLACLILITTRLTIQAKSVTDFLPAQYTSIYVTKPTAENLAQLSLWYPNIAKIAVHDGVEGLAVLSVDGTDILIALTRSHHEYSDPHLSHKFSRPPFNIYASDERAKGLIHETLHSLSLSSAFTTLRQQHTPNQSWSYIRAHDIPLPTELHNELLSRLILHGATDIALSAEAGAQTMTLLTTQGRQRIRGDVEQILPAPFLVLRTTGIHDLWQQLHTSTQSGHAMLENTLQQALQNMASDAISLQYDVWPLLTGDATVEFGRTASGEVVFALHGPLPEQNLEFVAWLEGLHGNQASNNVIIREQPLDDRFIAKDIQIATSEPQAPSAVGTWNVLLSNDKLLTAHTSDRFLISNTDVRPQLEKSVFVSMPNHLIAGGLINEAELKAVMDDVLFGTESAPAAPSLYQWSLAQKGAIRTFEITKQ